MRNFLLAEAPVETLLQIREKPVRDGDLVCKIARDTHFKMGWVARCEGWNVITPAGEAVVEALKLGFKR